MTLSFTTGVIFLLCCAYLWRTGECQTLHCLHDCVPHENTTLPLRNHYVLYRTYNRNRYPHCKYRNPSRSGRFQITRPIESLGSDNVRLLYSPGYLLKQRYANNMVVKYNVQCPEGRLPYLVYNKFRLQAKECYGSCEDHVTITCSTCGTSKSCGKEPTDNFYNLGQEHFSVAFRASRAKNDIGFQLSVICFDPDDVNQPGYSDVGRRKRNPERHDVAGPPTSSPPPPPPPPSSPSTFLPPPPPPALRVEVALSDVVTYRDNTITVIRGGKVDRTFVGIFRLVVRDASGGDHSFTRDAVDLRLGGVMETLRLRGPGELTLFLRTATFLRDSEPLALSTNEREVVENLTNELFYVIPPSSDLYITDITDSEGRSCMLIFSILYWEF